MQSSSKLSCKRSLVETSDPTGKPSGESPEDGNCEACTFLPMKIEQDGSGNPRPKLKKTQRIFKVSMFYVVIYLYRQGVHAFIQASDTVFSSFQTQRSNVHYHV